MTKTVLEKRKKIITIISICLLAVLLFKTLMPIQYAMLVATVTNSGRDDKRTDLIQSFDENYEVFETVKDTLIQISEDNDHQDVDIISHLNTTVYGIGENYVPATEEMIELFENTKKAMQGALLTRIRLRDNRILFGTDGNWYVLIYSIDGIKPNYMLRKNDNVHCLYLGHSWYLCEIK